MRKKPNGEECDCRPGAATANTTNLWTHQRIHHPETFTSLKKYGCLPEDRPGFLPEIKDEAKPSIAVRPKLTVKQRDHANRLAAEFVVADGEPFSRCESKRLRA